MRTRTGSGTRRPARRTVDPSTATKRVAAVTCDGGRAMRVSEVLRRKGATVITIEPDRSVRELLGLLAEHGIGAVVVSEDGTGVAGIVSERDVVRRLQLYGEEILDGPVAGIMTVDVSTCAPPDDLEQLMETMTEQRIRHLPVIEEGRLVGLVSIGDVVKHRISEVQAERDHLSAYITR